MMRTSNKVKPVFNDVAQTPSKPQLHIVREEDPAPPRYAALSVEDYRQWQYEQQCLQLAENLKSAATLATTENTQQQNQRARFSPAQEQTIVKQASAQENGGSIFSTAYSRFYFC